MTCYILDPVCALEFGHSLNALHYFSELAKRRWADVIPIASRHLPGDAERDGIQRIFEWYYQDVMPIDYRSETSRRGDVSFLPPHAQALVDFKSFIHSYSICSDDSIVFPSADYFSLRALLDALAGFHPSKFPKLYVRFIGVMENINFSGYQGLDDLLKALSAFVSNGGQLQLSTETSALGREIQRTSALTCTVTPYLIEREALPRQEGNVPCFLFGGSGRIDKGFLRIKDIIELVNRRVELFDIHFIVQNVPDKLMNSVIGYVSSLYPIPNLTLLNGKISESEIVASYNSTCASIMPYASDVYQLRGSAILMESISYGRLVIGQDHTGFSEQIRQFEAGTVCITDAEYADAIVDVYHLGIDRVHELSLASRKVYLDNVRVNYDSWLGVSQ